MIALASFVAMNTHIAMWCGAMFVFSGIDAGVKTYQNRNINTHRYLAVIPTGFLQTTTWAIGIYALTYNDFNVFVLFSMAVGGIIGCQLSMLLHWRRNFK